MKQTLFAIAAGAVLLGSSGVASAVDIGGINIPVGPIFAVAQIYENVVTAQNQVLTGYGKVDSINGKPVGDYCNNNCELTYTFGSYVVTSITPTQITVCGNTTRDSGIAIKG